MGLREDSDAGSWLDGSGIRSRSGSGTNDEQPGAANFVAILAKDSVISASVALAEVMESATERIAGVNCRFQKMSVNAIAQHFLERSSPVAAMTLGLGTNVMELRGLRVVVAPKSSQVPVE